MILSKNLMFWFFMKKSWFLSNLLDTGYFHSIVKSIMFYQINEDSILFYSEFADTFSVWQNSVKIKNIGPL